VNWKFWRRKPVFSARQLYGMAMMLREAGITPNDDEPLEDQVIREYAHLGVRRFVDKMMSYTYREPQQRRPS